MVNTAHLRYKLLGMLVMELTDLTFNWENSPKMWMSMSWFGIPDWTKRVRQVES